MSERDIVPAHIRKFYFQAWKRLNADEQETVRQMALMPNGRDQAAFFEKNSTQRLRESGLLGIDGILYPDTIYVLSGGK